MASPWLNPANQISPISTPEVLLLQVPDKPTLLVMQRNGRSRRCLIGPIHHCHQSNSPFKSEVARSSAPPPGNRHLRGKRGLFEVPLPHVPYPHLTIPVAFAFKLGAPVTDFSSFSSSIITTFASNLQPSTSYNLQHRNSNHRENLISIDDSPSPILIDSR